MSTCQYYSYDYRVTLGIFINRLAVRCNYIYWKLWYFGVAQPYNHKVSQLPIYAVQVTHSMKSSLEQHIAHIAK